MKKALVLVLTLFYLSVSIGVTVDIHYCMDKKSGLGLGNQEAKICNTCGMIESHDNGCCRNEFVVFKISTDQNKTPLSTLVPKIPNDFYNKLTLFHLREGRLVETKLLTYADPPLPGDRRLHLVNCVFLI